MAPLFANREEPTVGIVQHLGATRLDVGIGNAMDIVSWEGTDNTLGCGIDFFAYALAENISGYQLKIAAADGFFGLHVSFSASDSWQLRFRALHFSAHLVDGLYDPEGNTWKGGKEPIPFSRNFGEVVVAHLWGNTVLKGRVYAGFAVAPWVKPVAIRSWSCLAGVELHGSVEGQPYLAYNISLLGVPSYIATNTVQAGVKFGTWYGKGLRLFVTYQNGLDPFGQYYDVRVNYAGVGFCFDFW